MSEQKNYKYIIRLKQPMTYADKLTGEIKNIDSYFATEIEESTILPNAFVITIDNNNGTFKKNIAKDQISEITETV